jgi:hypothetical protein
LVFSFLVMAWNFSLVFWWIIGMSGCLMCSHCWTLCRRLRTLL